MVKIRRLMPIEKHPGEGCFLHHYYLVCSDIPLVQCGGLRVWFVFFEPAVYAGRASHGAKEVNQGSPLWKSLLLFLCAESADG